MWELGKNFVWNELSLYPNHHQYSSITMYLGVVVATDSMLTEGQEAAGGYYTRDCTKSPIETRRKQMWFHFRFCFAEFR